jgi:MSHA biogenesis protein MshM
MYLQHFGLKHDPLGKAVKQSTESEQQKKLLQKLNWLLETKGIGLITGDAGTGKTTTLREWVNLLNPMHYKIIYQADNHFRAFDIYSQLADTLGLDKYHRYSRLWRTLKTELLSLHDNKQIIPVWILDEAHHLPNNFLHELPSFLNYSFDTKNIMIIILCGLPSLKATINRSFYSALSSRLVFRFAWQPIDNLEQFTTCLTQAFKNAGKHESILSSSGIQLIHMASKGRLRTAHRIITQSLQRAALENLNHLPDKIIQESLEELQEK